MCCPRWNEMWVPGGHEMLNLGNDILDFEGREKRQGFLHEFLCFIDY